MSTSRIVTFLFDFGKYSPDIREETNAFNDVYEKYRKTSLGQKQEEAEKEISREFSDAIGEIVPAILSGLSSSKIVPDVEGDSSLLGEGSASFLFD